MNENMDCRVMKTCQEVQKLLGEDYEVQIQKTMKNNHCERLGITVRERNNWPHILSGRVFSEKYRCRNGGSSDCRKYVGVDSNAFDEMGRKF